MAENASLKVEIRKELTKSERKRYLKNGYIIGVINQKGADSVPIAFKRDEFRRVIKENGRNAIIKLCDSDNKSYDVIIKDFDISQLKYELHHVDFQKVSLNEEIKVEVALRFLGTDLLSTKRLIVNRYMDTIAVSALPKDIPETIDVDVSNKNDGDIIYVKDLVPGKGITIDEDPERMVAAISEVKNEAVEAETAAAEETVKSEVTIS